MRCMEEKFSSHGGTYEGRREGEKGAINRSSAGGKLR